MKADLKVIEGGTASDKGSEKWANKLRKDSKELSRNLDTGYMELAEKLWLLYDTPANGDPTRGSIFQTFWGYASFRDFVQEELGVHYKKAQRLLNIWKTLVVDLNLSETLRARIVSLGHSKVRELVRVLTHKNAEAWAAKGEKLSYQELVKAVQKYADEAALRQARRDAEGAVAGEDEPTFSTHEASDEPEDGLADEDLPDDREIPSVARARKNGGVDRRFVFYPDQAETVKTALARAQELSNSSSDSHNMSLICLDFLASNDFRKADEQQRLRYLVRFEQLLGFKLIVVDPGAAEVVYGISTLELLAKQEE